METSSKDTFEIGEARVVCGDKGAGAGIMGGLGGSDSMVFGYEGWGINSGEEGLDEVGSVGIEVMRVAADSPTPNGQGKGDGALGG